MSSEELKKKFYSEFGNECPDDTWTWIEENCLQKQREDKFTLDDVQEAIEFGIQYAEPMADVKKYISDRDKFIKELSNSK